MNLVPKPRGMALAMSGGSRAEKGPGLTPYLAAPAQRRLAMVVWRSFQIALLIGIVASNLLRTVAPEGALSLLLLAALAGFYFGTRRFRDFRVWGIYVSAVALFVSLRTYADATGIPISFAYPIKAESIFGVGTSLSAWLQGRFYTAGRIDPLVGYMAAIYVSYFTLHYVVGLAIWLKRRDEFATYLAAILLSLFVGLAVYFAIPTAPPWLASEEGLIDHVERIPKVLTEQELQASYADGEAVAGDNDVAAMPSLHMAISVVVGIAIYRLGKAGRLLGIAYALSMGVALIYLGEHYLLDVGAGAMLGLLAYKVAKERKGLRLALLPEKPEMNEQAAGSQVSPATPGTGYEQAA